MSYPRYPEYKDSGVAWLGEVPAHWRVEPFKRQIHRETLKIDALVAEQRRLIELRKKQRSQAMHRPDFKHDRRAIGMINMRLTSGIPPKNKPVAMLTQRRDRTNIHGNTPAMPLHDAHFGGFFRLGCM